MIARAHVIRQAVEPLEPDDLLEHRQRALGVLGVLAVLQPRQQVGQRRVDQHVRGLVVGRRQVVDRADREVEVAAPGQRPHRDRQALRGDARIAHQLEHLARVVQQVGDPVALPPDARGRAGGRTSTSGARRRHRPSARAGRAPAGPARSRDGTPIPVVRARARAARGSAAARRRSAPRPFRQDGSVARPDGRSRSPRPCRIHRHSKRSGGARVGAADGADPSAGPGRGPVRGPDRAERTPCGRGVRE